MRLAGLVAGDEERLAEAVMRHGHAGFGQQRGGGDHQRVAGEDALLFRPVAVGAGIGGRVDMRDATPGLRPAAREDARQGELAGGRRDGRV